MPEAAVTKSQELWQLADKNGDNQLSLSELTKIFKKINLTLSLKQAASLYNEVVGDSESDIIDKPTFEKMLHHLTFSNKNIQAYFKAIISGGKEAATLQEFKLWLSQTQGEKEPEQMIQRLRLGSTVTCQQFREYLDDRNEDLYNFESRQPNSQDTSQEWTRYFINSSHNTYLTGNQLDSASSVDAYSFVLKSGCRCVELDVWDGPKNEPVILHGHTLTSSILFKDAIQTIKEHAFVTSQYPVILSLELHCDVDQQKVLAQHLTTILGEALLVQPLKETQSPENLKGKFVVKSKKPETGQIIEDDDEDDDEPATLPVADTKSGFLSKLAPKKSSEKTAEKAHKQLKQAVELAQLVVYMQSKKFKSFDDNSLTSQHICSLSETKAQNLIKKNHKMGTLNAFIQFNNRSFTRVYPKGSRIDSSNISIVSFWSVGVQMPALNFQNFDQSCQLNHGLFLQNGKCGYVLKNPTQGPVYKSLSITVLSGQRLPKPNDSKKGEAIDPYVEVDMIWPDPTHDDGDCTLLQQTKNVDNNGFNPNFSVLDTANVQDSIAKQALQFNLSTGFNQPQISFVRFVVKDKDMLAIDPPVAFSAIPLNQLKKGLRRVQLYDMKGNLMPQTCLYVVISLC